MNDPEVAALRQPPHSDLAEQAILGALLRSNDAMDAIAGLEARHFYRQVHRETFLAVEELVLSGQTADLVTVHERLQSHHRDAEVSLDYLNRLMQETPSTANAPRYAEMIRQAAMRREMIAVSDQLCVDALAAVVEPAELISKAHAELDRIAEAKAAREPILAGEQSQAWAQEFERREQGKSSAISTGFKDLDRKLSGGFRAGQLVILAARPKMGKTALALNALHRISAEGHPCLLLSQEMNLLELHDRNVAAVGKIALDHLLQPKLMTEQDWAGMTNALHKIQDWPLYLDDQGGLRLADVRAKSRKLRRSAGLKVLAIDYLQLMDADGDNRNAQIETITRGLKALAKELDIAIVLLSQLNRRVEDRPNKRPQPADLRDSGAIEQDADVVMFLYRDEVYNPDTMDKGIAELDVALNRQGEPGRIGLMYAGAQTRFEDLDYGRTFGKAPEKRRSALRDD